MEMLKHPYQAPQFMIYFCIINKKQRGYPFKGDCAMELIIRLE
jgi:hypothetical protein